MQLIATARFQAALNRTTSTRPYAEKLAQLVADLSGVAEDVDHRLLRTPEDTAQSALITITSNRGLCGAYNVNVLRTALAHLDESKQQGIDTDVHMVGKKGIAYFRFLHRPMVEKMTHIGDTPRFEHVEPIANALMHRFGEGEIGSAYVAYMKFHSVSRQRPTVMQLLPLTQKPAGEGEEGAVGIGPDYELSPDPQGLLDELLPATVRVQLFQCFTDAAVSEQLARMVAMKAATDAAGDMITTLTRQYNRARQTQITMELLDIVGGANAMA